MQFLWLVVVVTKRKAHMKSRLVLHGTKSKSCTTQIIVMVAATNNSSSSSINNNDFYYYYYNYGCCRYALDSKIVTPL